MDFKQFTSYIQKKLKKQLNIPVETYYNSDKEIVGIKIAVDEPNTLIMIKLNTLFEQYNSTGKIEDIVNKTKEIYYEQRENIRWYRDFNKVQGNIYYMLLNKNVKGMLKDAIYEKYFDMVKVYYVYDKKMFKDGHVIIDKHHAGMWNVTQEEIFEIAEKNMQKQTVDIRDITNVIDLVYKGELPVTPLYLMEYKDLKYAAAVICNTKALREFSEKNENRDIFIIPSSRYEVLLFISDGENESKRKMQFEDMICKINNYVLEKEDVLSYNIFMYRYKTNIVEALL